MNRRARPVLISGVCVIVLLGAITAWAAITGSILGVVSDPSGAVVPGVTVVATSTSTNVQHTTVTDSKGFYAFPTLNVDHYNISISYRGYRDFLEQGVEINANSAVRIDVSLALGSVKNTVTVKSDVLRIETQSTQMGEVIQSSKITSVPLNGRSYIDLLALQPGVIPYQNLSFTQGVGAQLIDGNQSNGAQSINGGRSGSNAFMVNGADVEEGVAAGAALTPNIDSIAQFRIITNNFDAELGNYSGGQVNVVTKSGTNQYHGNAFDFLRNTDLDAKNYFAPTRGVFIQNQFGGTVGGPVRKDKVFFFGDYQGTRQIVGQTQFFPVPSTADRSGNLIDESASFIKANPSNGGQGVNGAYWANLLSQKLGYPVTQGEAYYTAGCTTTAQCVFPNAVIPQRAWSPVALNTLKYIPAPNVPGQSAFQTSAYNETLSDNKGGIRVDSNTRFGSLFGYYFRDGYSLINPYTYATVPGFDQDSTGLTQLATIGLTKTINNSTVNDLRLAYLRVATHLGLPVGGKGVSLASLGFNTPWNSTGGIGNVDPQLIGVPRFGFNNYNFGSSGYVLPQFNNTFQIIDNFIKIVGTHDLQFGADLHYDEIIQRLENTPNGTFNFNGNETGLDFADFLLGAPVSFQQGSNQILDSRSKYYGFYGQDSWRVLPTLTLNYGLRWEVSTPWYDTQNKLETVIQGEQSLSFPGAPLGLLIPGDPGVPKTLAPVRYGNFAPRIGIAYSPDIESGFLGKLLGGSGRTSIRAGYGVFYTAIQDATAYYEAGDPPYGQYWSSPTPPILSSPYIDRPTGHNEGISSPSRGLRPMCLRKTRIQRLIGRKQYRSLVPCTLTFITFSP